jgi:hypothetical protein
MSVPLTTHHADADGDNRWVPVIRVAGWLLALSLGALQAWAGRFPIGEDGVSYLDIADAYLRGDWANAFSAYWSPAYSWVLAAGLGLTRPSPYLESTIVHAINFVIYIGALGAFEFLLRQLLALHRQRQHLAGDQRETLLPANALRCLGYGLFVWMSLQWITVTVETPDMLLSALVYVAAGLLLRMRSRRPSALTFLAYGAVLGLAYLTKSAMLPLSMMFFVLIAFAVRNRPAAAGPTPAASTPAGPTPAGPTPAKPTPAKPTLWRGVALAAATFAIVTTPYIATISTLKGRVTFGDTGKLAYVWHANEALDRVQHWHAEFPDDRRPVHPTRKVFERPALYEFGSDPVGGSYPVWYDPSYWHEGLEPHFDLAGQLRTLRWSADVWRRLLITDGDFLLFGALVLLSVAFRRLSAMRRHLTDNAVLLIPFIVALCLYSIVLVSPRYVAVFAVLFWLGVFASVRLPQSPVSRRLGWAVVAAMLLMMTLRVLPWSITLVRDVREQRDARAHMFWQIAEGLREAGARPGDAVAGIGYGAPAYWARLARVRIVAELFGENLGFSLVPGIEDVVQPDGSLTPEILKAFAATGARFVIARRPPENVIQHGWKPLGEGTTWFALPLPR